LFLTAHLSRVFRIAHRQTIGEYVQQLSITYACKELAIPENDLVSVALSAGFADQSHSTSVFKGITLFSCRSVVRYL
jgi:AraC-like DNA-binding protein